MRYCEYRIGRSNSLKIVCPVIVSRGLIGGRGYGSVYFAEEVFWYRFY